MINFQHDSGAGALRVPPRWQTVLRRLLLRPLYSSKLSFLNRAENETREEVTRAGISFLL